MSYEKQIWDYLISKINNEYGVAGLMGNLYWESALNPKNLQNTYETSLGYTDESYTNAVDNGSYSEYNFVHDSAGYGLAQWTYYSRKQDLYNMYKSGGYSSIGSIELALDFLWWELQNKYSGVLSVLKSATSVRQASDKVLHDFENPEVQDTTVEEKRSATGESYYNTYSGTTPETNKNAEIIESAVNWAIKIANDDTHGYDQDLTGRWEGINYDCSSLCISAYQQTGVDVRGAGAVNTSTMKNAFVACGFDAIPYTSGMVLVKGDVILNEGSHVVLYIGNNQVVNASQNEFGGVLGGQSGDQNGKEIYVRSMYEFSSGWDYVLRLPVSGGVTPDPDPEPEPEPDTPTKTYKRLSKLLLFAIATDNY